MCVRKWFGLIFHLSLINPEPSKLAWCSTTAHQKEKAEFQNQQSVFLFNRPLLWFPTLPPNWGHSGKLPPVTLILLIAGTAFCQMQIDRLYLCLVTDMLYGMLLWQWTAAYWGCADQCWEVSRCQLAKIFWLAGWILSLYPAEIPPICQKLSITVLITTQ